MATCQKCGGPVYADEKFCPHCGAPVQAPADAVLPQSAQQAYGDPVSQQPYPGQPSPVQPQYAYSYPQDPTYAAYAQQYGQQYGQPVQAVIDPNTGAGIQIYTQPAGQYPQPYLPVQPPQPEKPKPDPNSPEGRAASEAVPIEFALKANKVGLPVFFGCNYDPMSAASTQQAYNDVYRAMGIEAQMSADMAAQLGAYKAAYSEMASVFPKPEWPEWPQPQPQPQPEPQPQPQPQQPLISIPAVAWPSSYGASFGLPQGASYPYAPFAGQQPAPAGIPAATAQVPETPAAETASVPVVPEGPEVSLEMPEEADNREAVCAALKEDKRNERMKKREERKALRKISAFD